MKGGKAESGQPNNPIKRTQAIRPSQVIGAVDGPFGQRNLFSTETSAMRSKLRP